MFYSETGEVVRSYNGILQIGAWRPHYYQFFTAAHSFRIIEMTLKVSLHYRCSLVSAGSNSSHHRSWSPRALQAHRCTSPFLCLAHMWVLVHICQNCACIRCHCKNLTWIAGVTLLGSISWLDILGIQTWLKTLHCGELRRNNGSRIWGRGWRIGEGRWKR